MPSIACRTLVFVSLFLFAAASLVAATETTRPNRLKRGPATVKGSAQRTRLAEIPEQTPFHNQPATGRCSIQLTYMGCRACCVTSTRIGGFLTSLCEGATTGSGGLVGGWFGSALGGLVGDLVCTPMMQDSDCYYRCIGKDGDPNPIACFDTGDPDEVGVCRQVCEQGQHNIGNAGCPTNGQIVLSCCVGEYDPPDDDECPDSLCPGPVCPPECDDVLP